MESIFNVWNSILFSFRSLKVRRFKTGYSIFHYIRTTTPESLPPIKDHDCEEGRLSSFSIERRYSRDLSIGEITVTRRLICGRRRWRSVEPYTLFIQGGTISVKIRLKDHELRTVVVQGFVPFLLFPDEAV